MSPFQMQALQSIIITSLYISTIETILIPGDASEGAASKCTPVKNDTRWQHGQR